MKTTLSIFAAALILSGCDRLGLDHAHTHSHDLKPLVKTIDEPISAEPTLSRRTAELINRLEGELKAKPNDLRKLNMAGFAYMQAGRETGNLQRYVLARQTFEKAVKLDPTDPESLHNLAWCLTSFHDFAKAMSYAKKAIEKDPSDAFAYGVLFDAHLDLGDYDRAVEAAQKMVDLRPDMASYSRGAQIRWVLGDIKGAQWLMGKAIQAGGAFAENTLWCRVQLGDMQLKEGSLAAAEQNFKFVLKANKSHAQAMAGIARVEQAKGNALQAVKLYEQSLKVAPQINVALDLALLQTSLGQDASAAYTKIEERIAEHRRYGIAGDVITLALIALERDNDPKQALKVLEHEVDHHSSVQVLSTYAWALHKSGDNAAAEKVIAKALKVGTQDALLWYRAAEIKRASGNLDEAKRLANAALTLQPEFHPVFARQARSLVLKYPGQAN